MITDGDVWNTEEIIATVYMANHKMRFFTIGIGNGISPFLIQGVAKAGRGDYDFVKDDENIEEKTTYLIKSAITPLLTDFSVSFYPDQEVGYKMMPDIERIGFIRKNERFELFIFLDERFLYEEPNTQLDVTISYFDRYDD